ncbi:type II secretion system F family protein [sulfur-oxidizing endosymbiont of Gigantopelta aegis]|uniref:type II secretion system F family protein n=1 Tax=sulfur-oxidizing endosymbiont of Gigantopelta aegis TaxID=2794934 RepID=UPI0018DD1114|nr:type II secretion system F family protein [sulfur-oxidizing endosymbiont of Gigantopelta aegis]
MSTLFKAGIPIIRAMNSLALTTDNDYLKEILEHSIKQLEAGQPYLQAWQNTRKFFRRCFSVS